MSEIEKLYENANIRPEYRYDCNLADTIKPLEVFPLCSCSKGEIKDYCTNKQDYRYCKVYKVNKIYPPFTAEKQIEVENIIFQCNFGVCELQRTMPAEFTKDNRFVKHYFAWQYHAGDIGYYNETIEEPYGDWDVEYSNPDRKEALAGFVNSLWDEFLTEEERKQIRDILAR